MDRILIILKKENGPRASSAPALGLNTIIFKYVYWYMKQISGERLQDHWSSGFSFVLGREFCLLWRFVFSSATFRGICYVTLSLGYLYLSITRLCKEVQVGKDQENAKSEKDSHSKNRGGKKPN